MSIFPTAEAVFSKISASFLIIKRFVGATACPHPKRRTPLNKFQLQSILNKNKRLFASLIGRGQAVAPTFIMNLQCCKNIYLK